jgi:outer membrane protein OmpA-like peptidoglycan-associated protein
LNALAAFLRKAPDTRLLIIGHTDNLGVEAANELVSAQRAAAVKEYLITQGVDGSRLESAGRGSSEPIETNATLLGRQANRRIEFLVVHSK